MPEEEITETMLTFEEELRDLINCHSKENGSDTPDYILSKYLLGCIESFDNTTKLRDVWWNHKTFDKNPTTKEEQTEASERHEVDHYPAPWIVLPTKRLLEMNNQIVCSIDTLTPKDVGYIQTLATAYLISAAPELLALCRNLIDIRDEGFPIMTRETIDFIDTYVKPAVHKADGWMY